MVSAQYLGTEKPPPLLASLWVKVLAKEETETETGLGSGIGRMAVEQEEEVVEEVVEEEEEEESEMSGLLWGLWWREAGGHSGFKEMRAYTSSVSGSAKWVTESTRALMALALALVLVLVLVPWKGPGLGPESRASAWPCGK